MAGSGRKRRAVWPGISLLPVLWAALVWQAAGIRAAEGPPAADPLWQSLSALQTDYQKKLDQLAAWCESAGLAEQAETTRRHFAPRDPYKIYVAALPEEVGPPALPADAPPAVRRWHERFRQLRAEYAAALYELARRVVRHRPALAYQLVLQAAGEDPDHEDARRVLGYEQWEGRWQTFYEVQQLRAGKVWDKRFGWIARDDLPRYERGERPYRGRWISAEQDSQLHRRIESGWDIQTEHYQIRTNHSLEAGVALGAKLERLFRVWQQLFIRYYASESQVVALFDGRARTQRARFTRLEVVYFRDRQEYLRTLAPRIPNVEKSIGLYLAPARRAYFFAGEEADDRTLYHEATHQLFHQSRPVAASVGLRANFWVVEGIALFMESLHQEGDTWVLGGRDDVRFYAARYRLLHDKFYVPLKETTTWGMYRVQQDPRIATLYSQFSGQTYFLIFYDRGRYRDALVAYLSTVYSGRDDPATLARLCGASYEELDGQYRRFIQETMRVEDQGPQGTPE